MQAPKVLLFPMVLQFLKIPKLLPVPCPVCLHLQSNYVLLLLKRESLIQTSALQKTISLPALHWQLLLLWEEMQTEESNGKQKTINQSKILKKNFEN